MCETNETDKLVTSLCFQRDLARQERDFLIAGSIKAESLQGELVAMLGTAMRELEFARDILMTSSSGKLLGSREDEEFDKLRDGESLDIRSTISQIAVLLAKHHASPSPWVTP
jgi:hypothetical protein